MNRPCGGAWAWARRAAAAVAVVAAGTNGHLIAGEPLSIARVYGAGVHAYFSGDYLRSYDDLTQTIEAGSRDPRTRYFRGLAALALGRLDEAEADFSTGALLEAEPGGNWSVSRSLERVQGHQRLQLERHRARARVAVLERARAMERGRYRQIQAAQPDVQRGRRPAALPSGPAETSNPFAEESGAGTVPVERAAEPEPMPVPAESEPAPEIPGVVEEPAAAGTDLQPEMEQPANASPDGAVEPPADGAPVELPGDDAGAPGAAPAAEPAAEAPAAEAGGAAQPATPAADEDPFDDQATPPSAP